MTLHDISSARLSDGRPQFLCGTDAGLFSTWKMTTDPDAAWSGWQPFATPFSGVTAIAGATLTDGRPQIFVSDGSRKLWSTWKVDAQNPDSAWADWTPFEFTQAHSVGAARLTDGRPQIMAGVRDEVWTTWKVDTNPNAAWAPVADFDSPGIILDFASVQLTDGRPQILGFGDTLVSNWKATTNPDAAWVGWQPFQPLPDGKARSLAGMARSDDLPEFVVVSFNGHAWRTNKMDKDPNAAWSEWVRFPMVENAVAVGAASLTDGRPQILIATDQGLLTTWQASDPDSGWLDPQPFDNPPGM